MGAPLMPYTRVATNMPQFLENFVDMETAAFKQQPCAGLITPYWMLKLLSRGGLCV